MRASAFERGELIRIAEDVKCLIVPGGNLVHLASGVPVKASDWSVLLEAPNAEITAGDFLVRSDGSELKVQGVRCLENGHVMRLEVNNVGVP